MSFMSVPALDRLLEPSETESTSVRSWSAKGDRNTVMNISPLFPSQPHAQPSPPQPRASTPPFSPSPYVLNFKRRVFNGKGTRDGIVEASCYDLDVAMQRSGGQAREATSSFRGESEVASDPRNKVVNNGLNEDGMLPFREVQDRLSLGGKSSEGQERSRVNNVDRTEKMMSNSMIKTVEANYNGLRKQEFGRGSRSRTPSIGQQDIDFSSSNREEFFDAPDEPFEGRLSVFC